MTAGWKRRAALATVIAARRPDGSVPEDAVRRAATAAGVTARQVRRWVTAHAPHLADGVAGARNIPDPQPRTGWEVTPRVLAVITANSTLKRAWQQLRDTDPATPSYPAFTAALRNYSDNGIARAVKGDGARTLIGSRMYLAVEVSERNARWELDSQEVPVFVVPSRGTKPVKLHQTTVIESKHRMVMATVFTPARRARRTWRRASPAAWRAGRTRSTGGRCGSAASPTRSCGTTPSPTSPNWSPHWSSRWRPWGRL
ncbi:hypothetical protein [Blastococcus brunescens]|uniref:Transposase n=1 Tax=Blastococcus brunescens TaxID=1564165 RepID=A0ABZ1AWA7_9ACTN|nr:hypothetical protein [Blastococcus sp. BMG 8361]WRL62417.1 hypothetical protein U6N30_20665 [Blastococcus sp. BMG 8361]